MFKFFKRDNTLNNKINYEEKTLLQIIDYFENKIIDSDCETLLFHICSDCCFSEEEINQIYLELLDSINKKELIFDDVSKYPVQRLNNPIYFDNQVIKILSYNNEITLQDVYEIEKKTKDSFLQSLMYISIITNMNIEIIEQMHEDDLSIAMNIIFLYYII